LLYCFIALLLYCFIALLLYCFIALLFTIAGVHLFSDLRPPASFPVSNLPLPTSHQAMLNLLL
jgi:hypothetical protein